MPDPMTPENLAARWLADVPKHNLGLQTKVMWILEADAIAAIARHLAPGDDLVERATAALDDLERFSAREIADFAVKYEADDAERWLDYQHVYAALAPILARITALTATVAKIEIDFTALSAIADRFKSDCQAAEAEAATLRDRLARMEGALTKAANRLDWAAGIIESDKARDQVGEWADEARAALTDGGPQ